ncbi:MAG: HEAT repeat domain-containing protein [Planctomycetes bacterium]|nr:HEAT repeat domain-containing protein [Planctomycetota bacterium]
MKVKIQSLRATAVTALAALALVPLAAPACPAADEPDLSRRLDEALKGAVSFEYGKDAGPLELAERLVVEAARDPRAREAVEQSLLRALGAAATRDAKDFLCRQLLTVATARSVPALEAMLADPDLSHLARYALERAEGSAADEALLRALGRTSGKLQAGMLSSLGRRRCGKALSEAAKLLASGDALVARAAAAALGGIGTAEAARALAAARPAAGEALRLEIDAALFACAEKLLAEGRQDEAVRIFEAFHEPGREKHLRIGALRGLAAALGAGAFPRLLEAVKGSDPELRSSAIELVRSVKGRDATAALAAILPSLAPEAQEHLVGALGARGDPEAATAIAAAAAGAEEGVRAAACEALGAIGGASHVDLLLRGASSGGARVEAAARESLRRLQGDGVDRAILQAALTAAPGGARARVEAIRALAARRTAAAFGDLLRLAAEDEPSVRSEAIAALGAVAREPDLPALAALAVRPKDPKDAIEGALAAALRRIADPERRAAQVLAALAGAPAARRPALLPVLGGTGAPGALQAIRGALADADAATRDAAVRVLAEWPDAAPAEDLLRLARTLPDRSGKAAALKGYVRMASLSKEPAAMYVRALEAAEHPEDRKVVLEGLGALASKEALELLEARLEDGDDGVRAAAGAAAVRIAERLRGQDPARTKAALEKVKASAKDPGVRGKAEEALYEFDKLEGHILAWLVAGPYTVKDKDSRAVFEASFPPEAADSKDVKWRRLRRGVGSWDVSLEAALGPLSHGAAYLRTAVWSPREQEVRLELGSDDAVRAWLNGQPVHSNYTNRGLAPRQDLVKAKLREGWNDLLLKVVNHEGPWGFSCRIRGPDGGLLEGLKTEAR